MQAHFQQEGLQGIPDAYLCTFCLRPRVRLLKGPSLATSKLPGLMFPQSASLNKHPLCAHPFV